METEPGSAAKIETTPAETPSTDGPTAVAAGTSAALSPVIVVVACLFAIVVPGAGHVLLGKWKRGLCFLLAVSALFWLGLKMHGHLFVPAPDDWLSYFPAFANAGSGLLYFGSWFAGIGLPSADPLEAFRQAGQPTFEYGNTFMLVSGLVNYLLLLDTFDIALGRKS